jgi:glutathione S-transferase
VSVSYFLANEENSGVANRLRNISSSLTLKSFLVGQEYTLADAALFVAIAERFEVLLRL